MVNVTRGSQLRIPLPANFNFNHCLRFLGRNVHECLHRVENGSWIKLIKLAAAPVIIQVRKESDHLYVDTLNTQLDDQQQAELVSLLQEVFDLNRDLDPFYQQMKSDPIMANLCKQYSGLRLLGIPDLFEALCWCIIGQQINLTFAYKLKKRLVTTVGEKLHYQGTDYYAFPSPQIISNMSVADFSAWQFSSSKATYLIGVAREFQKGNITKRELLTLHPNDIEQKLMELKGIGNWSAQYVMMKCLRIDTAFPANDVGLQNAIRKQLTIPQKPSQQQLQEFKQNWHPWQAYATFYLWHSLIS